MSLAPLVLKCRDTLCGGRERARRAHESGTPGRQVAQQLADLYDQIIEEVFDASVADFEGDARLGGIALVAHGGLGRCDLSPYSDADLMLLSERRSEPIAGEIMGHLVRDLNDVGIDAGMSIRRPDEALRMAWQDPVIYSSLTESRLVRGSLHVYQRYFERFRRGAIRRQQKIIRDVVEARKEERRKWGETAYLLRPNIKRSRGGLRDIQLIRWIGFARWGESDLESLVKLGLLPTEDHRLVRAAYDFHLRLRHQLHFLAGKASDILDRPLQMEISELRDYRGTDGMLPVEAFMQDYFAHVRNVRYAAAYCVEESTARPMSERLAEALFARRVAANIEMGKKSIWFVPATLQRNAQSLTDVLRLMVLANRHNRRIEHRSWRAIRLAMLSRPPAQPDDPSVAAFMDLLGESSRLAPLLRRLHDLRIIECFIPQFARIRGMLQFNAYHKFTVDAHSIRAVEAATTFEDDPGGIGRRYRRIDDKRLLHLTLLIHDIGKGFEEDHCIVGERMAAKIAEDLGLAPEDAETMVWLVRNHLIVNVVAFRHNLSDPTIVLNFAKDVGSIRRLELLVVHTVADLMAVGPDVATQWKLGLIEDLYRRTRRYFDSQSLPGSPDDPEIERNRRRVVDALQQRQAAADVIEHVASLPLSLLSRHPAAWLADVVESIAAMDADQVAMVKGQPDAIDDAIHLTVVRREAADEIGTFSRTVAAITGSGLSIARAQLERFTDFAYNDFWVQDLNFAGRDRTQSRVDQVTKMVTKLLNDPSLPIAKPTARWNDPETSDVVNVLPSKVVFDNSTIPHATIVSLFAYDSPGLLARTTRSIAEQRLVLQFAKIDTHLDQVADVFYVTEADGSQLTDPQRQDAVRRSILDSVSGNDA